jgi:hypothetical protein
MAHAHGRMGGAADPDGKAPFDMQLTFLRHRKAARAAVERMIAWKPDRVIIAHGRWYDANALFELNRALRWSI